MSEPGLRARRKRNVAAPCLVLAILAAGNAAALSLKRVATGMCCVAAAERVPHVSRGSGSVAFAAVTSGSAPHTPLPLKPSGSFDAWQVALKAVMVGALGIAAVIGGLYAWKNWKGLPQLTRLTAANPRAAVVESARRISPRSTLVVVRWEGRRYLLSESATQSVVIDSRPAEEPSA